MALINQTSCNVDCLTMAQKLSVMIDHHVKDAEAFTNEIGETWGRAALAEVCNDGEEALRLMRKTCNIIGIPDNIQ